MKNKKQAFTLVEMAIVIVLVMTLSVVAIPFYNNHILNAKRTEGYTLLAAIRNAQMKYYAEYEYFLHYSESSGKGVPFGFTSNENILGIDSRANKYFTCFTVGMPGGISFFNAVLIIPQQLKTNNCSYMNLHYAISEGSTIYESNYPGGY